MHLKLKRNFHNILYKYFIYTDLLNLLKLKCLETYLTIVFNRSIKMTYQQDQLGFKIFLIKKFLFCCLIFLPYLENFKLMM